MPFKKQPNQTKLLVLDRNTWNHTTLFYWFVLDEYKERIVDKKKREMMNPLILLPAMGK